MEEVNSHICKGLLSEFLSFLKHKVDNDALTISELQGLFNALFSNMNLIGTAEEIAEFYGKTPQDVRTVISRKMLNNPQRKVNYSVNEFIKVKPNKWKEKS